MTEYMAGIGSCFENLGFVWQVARWMGVCCYRALLALLLGFVLGVVLIVWSSAVVYKHPICPRDPPFMSLTPGDEKCVPANKTPRSSPQGSRILCWVMTMPKNHRSKALAVKNTWGPRCDQLFFMSSKADPRLPTIALPVKEGRPELFNKTREAFRYLQQQELINTVDWILKADDDTYVVVDNLRDLLRKHDPSEANFLGLDFHTNSSIDFMFGGAGYVLSQRAAHLFVTRALHGICGSIRSTEEEDVLMGQCMTAVNATFIDTRDADGKQRFYVYPPERYMMNPWVGMAWLKNYMSHTIPMGLSCCSNTPISFHYVSPSLMYTLEYLLYEVKIIGQDSNPQLLNTTELKLST